MIHQTVIRDLNGANEVVCLRYFLPAINHLFCDSLLEFRKRFVD
jgi:hypothetical protein